MDEKPTPLEVPTPLPPNPEPGSPQMYISQPFMSPQQGPNENPKKPRNKKKLIILAIVTVGVLLAAGVGYAIWNKQKPKTSSGGQKVPVGGLIESITNEADLYALNKEQQTALCDEIITLDPEGAELKAFHDRVGMDGGLYENLYLGCQFSMAGNEYARKDQSGENEEYYRRDAQKFKDIAQKFTFQPYDTRYKIDDLDLSKRVSMDIQGEAKNMLISYYTLVEGGFSPYSSNEAVRIQIFDRREFPELTSNCGPDLMRILYAHQSNNDPCEKTVYTFESQPVYKGKGIGNPSYNATVGNTRLMVSARNEAEAIAVLHSMKKVSASDLDFFIKN